MFRQVSDGVLVHESGFLQSKTVVVQGPADVLLIDPGITVDEMVAIANDLRASGQQVVAGFSTHPHWDHVLWLTEFGDVPRYGTARCAADIRDVLSSADWKTRVAEVLPPDIADEIPMDLFGIIVGLPVETMEIPWNGPRVRIIEHQGHAGGHAALLMEERGVLVAGDMLSDILIPFLDLEADDPVADYLAALRLFEGVADDVDVVVPGHGSVAGRNELRARIDQDRTYVDALRDGGGRDDPRLAPSAPHGAWLPDVHEWHVKQLAGRAS